MIGTSRKERFLTAATLLALAAAVAALGVLLVGGDDDRSHYLERLDAICVESKQALGVLAEEVPLGAASTTVYGNAGAELVAGWRAEVETLATPSELQADASSLGVALDEMESAMRSLAGTGGEEGTADVVMAFSRSISELDSAVEALGLSNCRLLETRLAS